MRADIFINKSNKSAFFYILFNFISQYREVNRYISPKSDYDQRLYQARNYYLYFTFHNKSLREIIIMIDTNTNNFTKAV